MDLYRKCVRKILFKNIKIKILKYLKMINIPSRKLIYKYKLLIFLSFLLKISKISYNILFESIIINNYLQIIASNYYSLGLEDGWRIAINRYKLECGISYLIDLKSINSKPIMVLI